MKRKTIPILFILMIFLPVMTLAFETLSTVYVDGHAPMTIDGILDDWENINVQNVQITNQIGQAGSNPRNVITTGGDADLTFSFKCFADARYVYITLMVTDDDIIIGNHDFGEGWKDDSTTIYFDGVCINISKNYFDTNDGMLKVIGAPPDGVKYIEGLIPYFFETQVPYFWESRGVKAGFQQYDTGYNVEVAIPIKMLGWNNIELGKTMGMNVRVVDMDSNIDVEETDKGLIWAPDPDHTSHFKTECYNSIVFAEAVSMSGVVESGIPGGTAKAIGSETRELEIELSTPDYTDGTELLAAALEDISNSNFSAAESKLSSEKEAIWVQPMLAILQLKQGKIEEGVQQLFDFEENCPDAFAEAWVKNFLKNDVAFLYEKFSGMELNNKYENVISIVPEFLKKYPDDIETKFRFARDFEFNENYDDAIVIYEEIINISIDNNFKLKAKLEIARNYFYMGDYQRAGDLA